MTGEIDRQQEATAGSPAVAEGLPGYELEFRVAQPDGTVHICHTRADVMLGPDRVRRGCSG